MKKLIVCVVLLTSFAFASRKADTWSANVALNRVQNLYFVSDYCQVCTPPHLEPCSPDSLPDERAGCENDNQEQQQRYDDCVQQHNECEQQRQEQREYCQDHPDDPRCKGSR